MIGFRFFSGGNCTWCWGVGAPVVLTYSCEVRVLRPCVLTEGDDTDNARRPFILHPLSNTGRKKSPSLPGTYTVYVFLPCGPPSRTVTISVLVLGLDTRVSCRGKWSGLVFRVLGVGVGRGLCIRTQSPFSFTRESLRLFIFLKVFIPYNRRPFRCVSWRNFFLENTRTQDSKPTQRLLLINVKPKKGKHTTSLSILVSETLSSYSLTFRISGFLRLEKDGELTERCIRSSPCLVVPLSSSSKSLPSPSTDERNGRFL